MDLEVQVFRLVGEASGEVSVEMKRKKATPRREG
jgi:hypothetical protein